MKRLILIGCICCVATGCASLGWTNEDSGLAMLASDVSVPANGEVVYTISRKPNTSRAAREWGRDMGMNRTFGGWFGINAGPRVKDAGRAKQQMEEGYADK